MTADKSHVRYRHAVVLIALYGVALGQAAEIDNLVYDASFFAEARPETAWDMVKRIPGFTFDSGISQNGTQARGYAGSGGNVLIDGMRPTAKADALDAVLERIAASDVLRIELLHAGTRGIDMQGKTVVANVIRKSASATTATTTGAMRVFPTGLVLPEATATGTHRSGQSTFEATLTVEGSMDDVYGARGRHEVFDAAGATLVSEVARKDDPLNLRTTLKGSSTTPLFDGRLAANVLLRNLPYTDRLTYESPGRTRVFDSWSRIRIGELGLNWTGTAGIADVETVLLQTLRRNVRRNLSDDQVVAQRFDSDSTSGESILRASLRFRPAGSLMLESGAEGVLNFLDGATGFTVGGIPVPLPSPEVEVEERRGEIYALADWKLSKQLQLNFGARFEASHVDFSGDTAIGQSLSYFKPKALLIWSGGAGDQVRLRYEKVVGQLLFDNFVATSNLQSSGITAGNGQLTPDRRIQYELAWERHFSGRGAFVASVMHEQIRDAVDNVPVYAPAGAFDAPGNIGDGRNDQFSLSFTLPLDVIGFSRGLLTGSGLWSISRVTDPTTGADRTLSNQRPRVLNFTLSQDVPSLKSSWSLDYITCGIQDKRFYRLSEVRQIRCATVPYLIARWSYQPDPSLSVSFDVQDLAGTVLEDQRTVYSGPRSGAAVASVDRLRLRLVPIFGLQVRKTFDVR